ncbi:TPA: hypothetical protein SMN05_003693 [Proteus mirabilis]|nr:hypothetical protein [Proteus mirabilis]
MTTASATQTPKKKAKPIVGINEDWSNYLFCLALHMTLPLAPLFIEALVRTDHLPSIQTMSITTSLYAIAIGLSSRNKALFGFCLLIGILFSIFFGITVATDNYNTGSSYWPFFLCLACVFIIHACERYNRHVAGCAPFLEFEQTRSK